MNQAVWKNEIIYSEDGEGPLVEISRQEAGGDDDGNGPRIKVSLEAKSKQQQQ